MVMSLGSQELRKVVVRAFGIVVVLGILATTIMILAVP
jgi:hypothetical protein